MIEAGLYIAAGFVCAVLIAMIVAPAIWRRAVFLTQRRIEESVPLTVSELRADKDTLRAEHAVAEKKLDLALRKQRDLTTSQAGRISDLTETLKARETMIAERGATIEELNAKIDDLNEALGSTQSELTATRLDLETTSVSLSARGAELESTSHQKAEVERKLDGVRAENEEQARQIATLEDRLGDLRDKLRAQQGLARDMRAEAQQTAELLKTERANSAELDQRHERLIQQASDLEEKLARREKEIVRLREAKAGDEADRREFERRMLDAEEDRAVLERELREMTVRFGRLAKLLGDREPESVLAGFDAQIARLETDLKTERRRVADLQAAADQPAVDARPGDDALREQIAELAAEIVHMAATLEGRESPVPQILATGDDRPDGSVSLAGRIRALQLQAALARRREAPGPPSGEQQPGAQGGRGASKGRTESMSS